MKCSAETSESWLAPAHNGCENMVGRRKKAVSGTDGRTESRRLGTEEWGVLEQLDHKDKAHGRYYQAVEWMEKNKPDDAEIRRFRAEAEVLLEVEGLAGASAATALE